MNSLPTRKRPTAAAPDDDASDTDTHQHKRQQTGEPLTLSDMPAEILCAIALHSNDLNAIGALAATSRQMLAAMCDTTLLATALARLCPTHQALTTELDRFILDTSGHGPLDELPPGDSLRPAATLFAAFDEAFILRFQQLHNTEAGLHHMACRAVDKINWRVFRTVINWRAAADAPPALDLSSRAWPPLNTLDLCCTVAARFQPPEVVEPASKILMALNAWRSASGSPYRPVVTAMTEKWDGDQSMLVADRVLQHACLANGSRFALRLGVEMAKRGDRQWLSALLVRGVNINTLWTLCNQLTASTVWGSDNPVSPMLFRDMADARVRRIDLSSAYMRQLAAIHDSGQYNTFEQFQHYASMMHYLPDMLSYVMRNTDSGAPEHFIDLCDRHTRIEIMNCVARHTDHADIDAVVVALVKWRHPVTRRAAQLFSVMGVPREPALTRSSDLQMERYCRALSEMLRDEYDDTIESTPRKPNGHRERNLFIVPVDMLEHLVKFVPIGTFLGRLTVSTEGYPRVHRWLVSHPDAFVRLCVAMSRYRASLVALYEWFHTPRVTPDTGACLSAMVAAMPARIQLVGVAGITYEAKALGNINCKEPTTIPAAVASYFLGELNTLRAAAGEPPTDYTASEWSAIRGACATPVPSQ